MWSMPGKEKPRSEPEIILPGDLGGRIGKVFIKHFASGGTLLDFNPPDYREFIKKQRGIVPKGSSSPIAQDEFTLQTRIGEINYTAYTLEDSFELLTGEWTIEIWYDDQRLGTQSFKIIDLNSGCTEECEGF